MKKIILAVVVLFAITSTLFCQEEVESVQNESLQTENNVFRIGAAFPVQSAVGDLNQFAGLHLGPGVQGEYDLNISLPDYLKLGVSAKFMMNFGFLKDDILLSMWNMQLAPGFYARFVLLDGNFIIQPELSYGLQLNFLKKNDEYNNKVDNVYLDQIIEFAVGFRYVPQNLLDGRLEFGITPFYALCPEAGYIAQYAGADIFMFYRL